MDVAAYCGFNATLLQQTEARLSSFFAEFTRAYGRVHLQLSASVCVVGVLCNLAIVVVLLQRSMRRGSVNILLIAIALLDMLLMALHFVYHLVSTCSLVYYSYWWTVFAILYGNLSVIAHSASLWLTVAMAVFRFAIIKRPQHAHQLDTARSALAVIGGVCVAVGAVAAPNITRNRLVHFGLHAMPPPHCALAPANDSVLMHVYGVRPPDWWSCSWERANYWLTGVFFKIVPCALLSVFMALLMHQLVEAQRRRGRLLRSTSNAQHDRTTVMLLLIVLVFLLTELPHGVLVVLVGAYPAVTNIYNYFGDVLDLLSLLNSCVNFILYCWMSSQFRQSFSNTFCKCAATGTGESVPGAAARSNPRFSLRALSLRWRNRGRPTATNEMTTAVTALTTLCDDVTPDVVPVAPSTAAVIETTDLLETAL